MLYACNIPKQKPNREYPQKLNNKMEVTPVATYGDTMEFIASSHKKQYKVTISFTNPVQQEETKELLEIKEELKRKCMEEKIRSLQNAPKAVTFPTQKEGNSL